MAAPRQEVGRDPPVASPQAPVTFEDVAVQFSAEEWELLEEWQRELHREVTEGTSRLLASLGPPSSPALGALVRLVKEIPEFLFGGPKAGAEPRASSSRKAAAGSKRTGASGPSPAESPAAAAHRCPQSGDGAGCPGSVDGISSGSSTAGEAAPWAAGWGQGQNGGLCCSPVPPAGALVLAVHPSSLAGTPALGACGTTAPGDARPAGSMRPLARSPAMGMVTKRPSAEAGLAGAASPLGSGTRPGSCGGVSSPQKRHAGGTPLAPREPPAEGQDLRAEVGRACGTVLVEELEQLCHDPRSVRREVWGTRSRLERGRAREMAALIHGRRRLHHTIRHLEGQRQALETRSWRNRLRLLGLPERVEGSDAIGFPQTTLPAVLGLPPVPAPLQIESARRLRGPAAPARPLLFSLLRFADKLAVLRAARRHPEPPSWAGTRLAIVPAACPP